MVVNCAITLLVICFNFLQVSCSECLCESQGHTLDALSDKTQSLRRSLHALCLENDDLVKTGLGARLIELQNMHREEGDRNVRLLADINDFFDKQVKAVNEAWERVLSQVWSKLQ